MGAKAVVLIGFAESLSAPEVAWSLLDAGFCVHAFARRGRAPALVYDRRIQIHFITAPEHDYSSTLIALQQCIDRIEPAAVFPLDDTSIWLLNQPQLRTPLTVGPVGAAAALALNKSLQVGTAAAAGFAVPPTIVIDTEDGHLPDMTFPCVLKPAMAVFPNNGQLIKGRSAYVLSSDGLLRAVQRCRGAGPLMIQSVVVGTGRGLFGIAMQGAAKALSSHERVRMMNPAGSGASACISREVDPVLISLVNHFVRLADWHGLFMVELLRDRNGVDWFVELNGRPWGSMALARRCGFEYPAWALQWALDPHFEPPAAPSSPGVLCRHLGREIVHALFVMRGRHDNAPNWPRRLPTLLSLLRKQRRPTRWYNYNRDAPRVFLADTLHVVASHLWNKR